MCLLRFGLPSVSSQSWLCISNVENAAFSRVLAVDRVSLLRELHPCMSQAVMT